MSDINAAASMICPYCGRLMEPVDPAHPRFPSRDHIRPNAWGRNLNRQGAVFANNIRIVCRKCNILRAACGHCIGVLACVLAVKQRTRQDEFYILKCWGLSGAMHLFAGSGAAGNLNGVLTRGLPFK